MKISLRGERDNPVLCYERDGRAYPVASVFEWAKSNLDPAVLADLALADCSWNPLNFLDNARLWPTLRAAAAAVDERGWSTLSPLPAGVPYLPPIPDPPLFFGLAGNCPMTWRPASKVIPNYPVGYTRTCHTLRGHQERVRLPAPVTSFRCAVELGVVIGRRARDVRREDAMQHVAGYTVVNDMISNHWKEFAAAHNASGVPTFEELLLTSYYGRGTTGFAPFGPWIVDRETIGNPYDLMMYSRVNGVVADRSHTNAMVVGIDAAIEYFSAYFTLEPGAIIHMGTMGIDGITLPAEKRFGPDDYVELEIENVGSMRTYFDDLRTSAR